MHGITAVVLEYHLPDGRSSVPALDAHERYVLYAPTLLSGRWIRRESGSWASLQEVTARQPQDAL
jgi:hypothetical protein